VERADQGLRIGGRAFVRDAEGYPEWWADAEVKVMDIAPSLWGDESFALAHVHNVQTGAGTHLFVYRLEPISEERDGGEG
jgi:hypothetical protein